jgi:hypothetical protein
MGDIPDIHKKRGWLDSTTPECTGEDRPHFLEIRNVPLFGIC